MNIKKNIAVVANDNKKTDLIEWSYFNRHLLMPHTITATGNAGNILEGTLNKQVTKLSPIGFGGYQELSVCIVDGNVDIIIFFGLDEEIPSLNKNLSSLMETALANNIIIASNTATADFILTSALMQNMYDASGEKAHLKTA